MDRRIAFHYLVRGILIVDGMILVAHQLGAENTFLPGGHIMTGERAEQALRREIEEEIGICPSVKRFFGAVEHVWPEDTAGNHELNLLFEIEVEGLKSCEPPLSREAHLEFLWVPTSKLVEANLLPSTLISLIDRDISWPDAYWASSMDKQNSSVS